MRELAHRSKNQMAVISGAILGACLAHFWGWSIGAGLVLGLSLSVASTVVLLRALESRNMVDTERGRIAIGWLIVQDLYAVFVLVLMPVLLVGGADNGGTRIAELIGIVALKIVAFSSGDPAERTLRERLYREACAAGAMQRAHSPTGGR